MRCRRCHRRCLSHAEIAEQLVNLRKDARRTADEIVRQFPCDEAYPSQPFVIELAYVDLEHRRLASELRRVCSVCWQKRSMLEGRWIN